MSQESFDMLNSQNNLEKKLYEKEQKLQKLQNELEKKKKRFNTIQSLKPHI